MIMSVNLVLNLVRITLGFFIFKVEGHRGRILKSMTVFPANDVSLIDIC